MKKTARFTPRAALCALLTLALCALCALPAAATEAPPKLVVGMLQLMDHPSLKIIEDAIRAGLDEYGITDRIELKFQNAQGDFATATALANQFVAEGCTLLVPITTPCAQAAVAAAMDADVDVIFTAVTDPVAAGLVDAPDQIDRVTGVSDEVPVYDVFALAEQLTPGFSTVGLLYNAGEANSVAGVELARAYCAEHGLAVVEAVVANTSEVMQAAQSLAGKADICFTSNDNTVAGAMPVYAQVGLDNLMPIYVGADTMVADGGLATVGIDYTILGRQTARMIRDYLDGTPLSALPVEYVTGAQPIINLDTAQALGLTPSEDLLAQVKTVHTGDQLGE